MDIEATYTVKMNWRGSEGQYIAFAEELSRRHGFGGLDSLDAGDATGFFSMYFLAEAHKEQDAAPFAVCVTQLTAS